MINLIKKIIAVIREGIILKKNNRTLLSDKQFEFLKDFSRLINYCVAHEIKITGGELYRTEYQHAEHLRTGKSKIATSRHLKRLAIDLNFFIDGKLCYDFKELEKIGDYWQGLNPKNRWGGFWEWKDIPHFERLP